MTSSKTVHEPYIWPKRPKSYERAWRGPKKWCINYIVHHLVWGQLPTQKDGKYPWPFLLGHLLHRVVKIKKDKSYWWGGWGVWSANSLSQVYNKCIRQIELCREKSFGAAAKASIRTSSIQWKAKLSNSRIKTQFKRHEQLHELCDKSCKVLVRSNLSKPCFILNVTPLSTNAVVLVLFLILIKAPRIAIDSRSLVLELLLTDFGSQAFLFFMF